MKLKVVNQSAKAVGDIELDDLVYGLTPREDILARVVAWQLAKRRSGNHKAKVRSEVSGSTKKIYKQKGTGNARHGARRGAQFRKGGIIFGPVVRSHEYDLPKKVRKLGLRMALSAKAQAGNLIIVDNLMAKAPNVNKEIAATFHSSSMLFVANDAVDVNFARSISNIIGLDVLPQMGANVYDIVRKEKVVMTSDAAKALEERLK
ncbi:MAG: 50S ribosomal protein L4 [Pseudomonadota bacterium]|jgi:large subunit ribosomal protein L4|nr:50S ribosomal protein L4 [Alphaproteobacteria bacterium]